MLREVEDLQRIRIVSSGKIRNRFIADGIEEYKKRISSLAKLELIDQKRNSSKTRAKKDLQGSVLLSKSDRGFRVALDPQGSEITSEELADLLRDNNNINFIIGGPDGLPRKIIESCDRSISLTRLTLTSELAKLVLIEQIYRALTIINSHPYHK